MLGMKAYPRGYIDACKAKIKKDVAAYKKDGALLDGLEATYFNNLVLVLEYMFEHRMSGIEGKDGNPLNEVRIIANSLILNGGKLQVDRLPGWPNSAVSGLKLPPEKSILGLKPGDKIRLSGSDFDRLSKAFFSEIESRFT